MTRPTATPTTRAQPDHWEEHVMQAQQVDVDKPQGILAYQPGSGTSLALSSSPLAIFTLTNVVVRANRFYLISCTVRALQTAATGGTFNLQITANSTLIASVHGYQNANQWWSNFTWAMPYVVTTDTTTTFVANLYGPASSLGWTDRGGRLALEDKGRDRGKQ